MADLVKMQAKTTFRNTRIRGGTDHTVNDGDRFETDPQHAKELARLGHTDPVEGGLHDIPDAPLEPHHQVGEAALRADRHRRARDTAPVEPAKTSVEPDKAPASAKA